MVQKLADEGLYQHRAAGERARRQDGKPRDVKFEVTDKSVDFLGFKTLKDLMAGSAAPASARTTRGKCRRVLRQAGRPSCTSSATR